MKVYDGQDFNEVINAGQLVLVKFFATWCNPCKMLAPVVEKVIANESDIVAYDVDVDKFRDLAVNNKVKGVPTMILFKDGVEVDRQNGYLPEPKLQTWLDSNK